MQILILGVGNILYTDEAIGVKAVLALQEKYQFPDNVTLMDGGTLGHNLMDALMNADLAIIVDAVKNGYEAGTICRLVGDDLRKSMSFRDSMHQTDLVDTLIMCDLAGSRPDCVVIGMEPKDYETLAIELSPEVQKNMPRLIDEVLKELTKYKVTYQEI